MRSAQILLFLSCPFAVWALGTSGNYTSLDLHCSERYQVGFVHNSFTYNTALHKFTDIVDSFFDVAWYNGGVAANITTGKDNVPGATRSGPAGSNVFNETLTAYLHHPGSVLEYSFTGAPASFSLGDGLPSTFFPGYAETMRLQSICSGAATYIDLISWFCSDNQVGAYDIWYTTHLESFGAIKAKIGAMVMAGDCPAVGPKHE
ncbi:hypothetical protein C8F01DRAFT_1218460 [Mycena amicta]|nr:hypothetical protein C8F01DRAFT_1218460 [Mycena amicta]